MIQIEMSTRGRIYFCEHPAQLSNWPAALTWSAGVRSVAARTGDGSIQALESTPNIRRLTGVLIWGMDRGRWIAVSLVGSRRLRHFTVVKR